MHLAWTIGKVAAHLSNEYVQVQKTTYNWKSACVFTKSTFDWTGVHLGECTLVHQHDTCIHLGIFAWHLWEIYLDRWIYFVYKYMHFVMYGCVFEKVKMYVTRLKYVYLVITRE
jgi:hypothetical protein